MRAKEAVVRKTPAQVIGTGLYYALCIALAVVFAGPFVWMVSSSLKPADEIFTNPPVLLSEHFSLDTTMRFFEQAPF